MEINEKEYEYNKAMAELNVLVYQLIVLDLEHIIKNATRHHLVKSIGNVMDYLGENKQVLIDKEINEQ